MAPMPVKNSLSMTLATGVALLPDEQIDRDRNHHRDGEDHAPDIAPAVACQVIDQLRADERP